MVDLTGAEQVGGDAAAEGYAIFRNAEGCYAWSRTDGTTADQWFATAGQAHEDEGSDDRNDAFRLDGPPVTFAEQPDPEATYELEHAEALAEEEV